MWLPLRKQSKAKSLFFYRSATLIPTENNKVSISSDDESEDATPVDSSDDYLNVISTKPKDSVKTNLNWTSSNHNYVSLELFDLFYDDMLTILYKVSVPTKKLEKALKIKLNASEVK